MYCDLLYEKEIPKKLETFRSSITTLWVKYFTKHSCENWWKSVWTSRQRTTESLLFRLKNRNNIRTPARIGSIQIITIHSAPSEMKNANKKYHYLRHRATENFSYWIYILTLRFRGWKTSSHSPAFPALKYSDINSNRFQIVSFKWIFIYL